MDNPTGEVTIALVGKYSGLRDSYKSITESLIHAGIHTSTKVNIRHIRTEELKEENLADVDGILVPGGFGERGMADKALAIRYARENKIPYFGLCLGMQLAVIEFARNVLNIPDADSTEADPETPNPVITILEGLGEGYGGTLRLGDHICEITEKDSHLFKSYRCKLRKERHRHRYEFNNEYREAFKDAGMKITGVNSSRDLVEAVELATSIHPWFVAVQFHPEFSSTFTEGHPLFIGFLEAVRARATEPKPRTRATVIWEPGDTPKMSSSSWVAG
jgi:CTP synthase